MFTTLYCGYINAYVFEIRLSIVLQKVNGKETLDTGFNISVFRQYLSI